MAERMHGAFSLDMTQQGERKMRNRTRIVRVLALSVGLAVLTGCGKATSTPKAATLDVQYTSGSGVKAGAFDRSESLAISSPSFDGTTVVFTYKNTEDDGVGGYVFGVIVRTYNADGVEVDKVEKTLYPGDITLPCTGKIISVPTSTKQQDIARVEIEHVGLFSRDRFSGSLDRLMGR